MSKLSKDIKNKMTDSPRIVTPYDLSVLSV